MLAAAEWDDSSFRSPAAFVAWQLGTSSERAKALVSVAERRHGFPTIMAAFDRGELSLEQVAEIVKAPTWAEARQLDIALISTVAKLRHAMRSCMFEGDPNERAAEPKPPVDRLSFGTTSGGRWRFSGELGIDDGRRIESALNERRDALFTDGTTGSLRAPSNVAGSAPSSHRRDEHYRTWIHLDVTAGEATTTDGWHIPMAVQQHLLCDGVVQPVWEQDGVPFSVGRSQRIVPERTRRVVERRDRGCRVPGCTADRFVEIHHVAHWLDGGPTDTSNLLSLCPSTQLPSPRCHRRLRRCRPIRRYDVHRRPGDTIPGSGRARPPTAARAPAAYGHRSAASCDWN